MTVTTSRATGIGQKAAARTRDAVKIYGKGQVEVRFMRRAGSLARTMKDQGFTAFSLPMLNMLIVVVLAAVAGVVAAILPSRRAAKLNIIHAIVGE